jgi:hypothetical protein
MLNGKITVVNSETIHNSMRCAQILKTFINIEAGDTTYTDLMSFVT